MYMMFIHIMYKCVRFTRRIILKWKGLLGCMSGFGDVKKYY